MTCREMEAEMLRLKSVPCMDCLAEGRDGIWPACVMQFDHVRGSKISTVRDCIKFGNEERFRAEIAKCDVVCANHHAIRTAGRKRSGESLAKMSKAQRIAQNRTEVREKKSKRISEAMLQPSQRDAISVRKKVEWSRWRLLKMIRNFNRKEWMTLLLDRKNE